MKPENKRFYKGLAVMVLPMAIQNLLTSLVSASDALMLGLLDQDALSAISLASQINFIQQIIIFGLVAGTSVLAAQYWGKKDGEAVEKVLGITLRYGLLGTSILCLASIIFPQYLMRFFTNDPHLIELGIPYLRIVAISHIFVAISQTYLTIMKTTDRVKRSSIFGSTTVVLNIILNSLLIFGLFGLPKMEIAGAALATTLSRGVEVLLCLIENRKKDVVRIRVKRIFESYPILHKDFWHYTTPLLANMVAWGGAMTAYSAILGHLGSDAVAAHSIGNIVKNIIDCVGGGVGIGASIILGNQMGRGELGQAKKDGARFLRISLVVGTVAGLIILACTPLILKAAYTLTPQAKHYLKYMLFMCAYYMIGRTLNTMLINGIFTAGGDTRFGFWCDLINLWVVIIPAALVAAFLLKAPVLVVYFILYLDEFTKIPAEIIHYKKYKWVKNITRENV
ncbi:MAG: MATE family efflux transporter [Clostridiales bacterium]|nr:MATE family efflux transporter [Clostridiales bacterium]